MDRDLDRVLGEEGLARFRETGPLARGLPAPAYTSEAFLALENERLFARAWVFAGFAHELARPGDVVPATVAGMPVILVRDSRGELRAFHNVCRHRGTTLVDEPRNVGRVITCPYHAWAYGLDGALRSAPHFSGPHRHGHDALERENTGLVPIRVEAWHDWIFVNPSSTAPDFEAFIAPVARRMAGMDLSRMQPVATVDFGEVRANWKFLMENYIEPYHVQFVHSTTTEQPLTDHYTIVEGHCLGSAVEISRRNTAEGERRETLAVDSWYLTLFPNFVIGGYYPDQLGVHHNEPLAVDRTRQRRVIYHVGDAPPSAEAVDRLVELWRKVHEEDHAICERLQKGRASAAAREGGPLSPHWEDSLRRFQELVLEAVA